jgi:hypothetical protein
MSLSRRISIYPVLLILLISASALMAQDSTATGWKTSLVIDITTTQAAYSDSWTGGEVGSFSWVSNLNGSAERQLSPSFNFRSQLKLSFGQTLSQRVIVEESGLEKKVWEKPKKSTDLIDWENVGRLTRGWVVDPYAAVRLESQFMDASIEVKKRYLTPLKLTESSGIARKLYARDNDQIITRLGLAIRQTFIKGLEMVNDTTFIGRDTTLTDGGIESVTDVNLTLRENVQYTGKLTLYKALFFSEKDKLAGTPQANYWKAVDVNWENIVSAKITKIITVNFYMQFLYDKQVELRGRLKETLGVGFVFQMI